MPRYAVWHAEDDDDRDAGTFDADSPASAAVTWAEGRYEDEEWIESPVHVAVRELPDGAEQLIRLEPETTFRVVAAEGA